MNNASDLRTQLGSISDKLRLLDEVIDSAQAAKLPLIAEYDRTAHLLGIAQRSEARVAANTGSEPQPVRAVKLGEYVRRKADSAKTYRRGPCDAASKRFSLIDCDDTSREVFVKGGTMVFVGFTY